jgi:WD40 repeat protein
MSPTTPNPAQDQPAGATAVKVDPAQTHQVLELKHTSPPVSCRFDPSGRFLLAGAQDNTVQRWELATGKKTALTGHQSWVRALAALPKDNVLITADYQGRILWWPLDAETPTPLRTVEGHRGWVRAVALSPDGKLLVTCGNDHLVKLWSAADGSPVRQLAGHTCHVYNVAFHPSGEFLVSADLKGVLKQWDLARGAVIRELDASVLYKFDEVFRADIGGARSLEFSPDGTRLGCAGITNCTNAFAGVGTPAVLVLDWQSGQRKQLLLPKDDFSGQAWRVVFHPAGFVMGAGSGRVRGTGALWFWKPDEAQPFFTLKLPTNARDMDLHPDGRRIAVASAEGAVRIYDMVPKATG